jgi:hypothetical protein
MRLPAPILLGFVLLATSASAEEHASLISLGTLEMTGRGGAEPPLSSPPVNAARGRTQATQVHHDEIYVFDVSVNVSNMAPEVEAVGVSCSVCDAFQCETRARNAVGGEGSHYFAPGEARSFAGIIPVQVKKPTIWKPLGYICTLNIKVPELDEFVPVELNADALPQAQPQPNTPLVAKLMGRLPAPRAAR